MTDALAASFTHFWMVGGNSGTDHGTMRNAVVGPGYCQAIQAQATSAFVPWTALQRAHEPGDGWFVAVEYLGNWTLAVERRPDGPAVVSAGIADLAAVPLGPGERIELPAVTIGAFAGSLDDMGVRSYDWQYRYRWDCTNMDYYARPKWAVAWTYCARNLQEQFAERLAYLDMDADLVRAVKSDVPIEGAWPTEEDAALYQHGRQGREFAYSIPVPAGLYSVRLKFAEPRYEWLFERPFHVSVNGREVLRNFDICQDARGCRKAHDRVFRYVVPNAEGQIVLRFSAGSEPGRKTGPALVQAIEVVPEIRPVVRISCGAEAEFIDWNSLVWSADCGFSGGRPIGSSATVAQASPTLYDQALYQTARAGRSFCYALSLPPGLYAVHVKVAELWLMDPGKRPMDIAINGKTVWRSWDAAAAGQVGMACDLRALNITPDKTGTIAIQARAAGENDAILQAIEVE